MFDKSTNGEIAKMAWDAREREHKGRAAERVVDTILCDSMKKLSYDNLTAIFIDVRGLFA